MVYSENLFAETIDSRHDFEKLAPAIEPDPRGLD